MIIYSIIVVSITTVSSIVIAYGLVGISRQKMGKIRIVASTAIGITIGIAYTVRGKPLLQY